MGGSSPANPAPDKSPDRLDSWKEIAAYLKRDVTTVQRWEKRETMPVHRHQHDRIGSVYAFRSELDAWSRSRNPAVIDETSAPVTAEIAAPSPPVPRKPKTPLIAVGAVVALLVIATALWLQNTEYLWKSPIAEAGFQTVTDFDGVEQAAAVSRDGKFVAFLSDRDGSVDVWITQVGSGQFHNLTHGRMPELVNDSVRTLGFSPDGSLVTFWVRRQNGSSAPDISVWEVPALGGEPKEYLEGVAEYDWNRDGSRLAFHTPGPGDPLYVTDGRRRTEDRPIFTAPAGLHAHFPLWSPDGSFLYFVQGTLPDKLDIWRIPTEGGTPEKVTSHNSRVTHPAFLDDHTLAYLASEPDGTGQQIYSIDINHRIPHRLTTGVDHYTSLAASANGRRLVATVASIKRTLWRVPISDSAAAHAAPVPVMKSSGYSPRVGPGYVLFVSAHPGGESIHKLVDGTSTELWNSQSATISGGPAISADGKYVAFSVRQQGQSLLYVMQSDGANARVVADKLDLQGDPAWAPDATAITTAANERGVPHLYRISLNGQSPAVLVDQYAVDPAWSPDGSFVVYSGADIGTTFAIAAAGTNGSAHPLPLLNLPRGSRHLAFLPGAHSLVVLLGEMHHKDIWSIDLATGIKRQLTHFASDFDVRDFDLSADGREVIIERQQSQSDIVLLDRK